MLNFGLISMPVKLYSAVRSKTVHFNHLHGTDHARSLAIAIPVARRSWT